MITSTAPYNPGQAIYYTPYPGGLSNAIIPTPAIVLRATEKRVRIRLDNGREASVSARYICYRGYCEACELPAVEDAGQLLCPHCAAPAVAAIPPDRILFDQLGELPIWGRAARAVLAGHEERVGRSDPSHVIRAESDSRLASRNRERLRPRRRGARVAPQRRSYRC